MIKFLLKNKKDLITLEKFLKVLKIFKLYSKITYVNK